MYAVCGSSPLSSILLRYEGDSDWVAVVLGGTARSERERGRDGIDVGSCCAVPRLTQVP